MRNKLKKLLVQLRLLKDLVLSRSRPKFVGLHPKLQTKTEQLIVAMFNQGHAVMVFQGYRSCAEQNYLYSQGRTRPGPIVTNAKCGESRHNFGEAVDVVFMKNGRPSWSEEHPWDLLGKTGESLGLVWGGRWKSFPDRPHFQLPM